MRLHWIAATFLLGLIIVLNPTHTPAQPPFGGKGGGDGGGFGGKGGKGKKDRTGDYGAYPAPAYGGSFPGGGGGAFPAPGAGGAFPAPSGGNFPGGGNREFTKGGGGAFPGGGGGYQGGGGGAFPGGGGGGAFPGGGGPGRNADPNAMWDRMAQGRESINLNEPAYSWMKGMMERQGQPVPPDGIVTRQMFVDEATKRMAARNTGNPGGPGAPTSFSFSPNGPMPGAPMTMTMGPEGRMNFGPGGPGGGGDRDRGLERLRDQDRDGDGKISREEADRQLQPNFDRIDRDGDGFITLDEYRTWYANQNQGRDRNNGNNNWDPNGGGDMNGYNRMDPRRDTEEPKPVAMRYGHLPKDLPEWFDTDDTTKDGQIALFEWRKAGKSIAEFEAMDLNGDGLITADELLRFERKRSDDQRIAAIMDGTGVRPSFASRGPNGKGPNGPSGGVTLPGASPDPISADRPVDRPYGKGQNREANGERPEGKGKGPNRDASDERPEGKMERKGKGPNRDGNTERPEKGASKTPSRDEEVSDKTNDRTSDDNGNGGESKPNPFRKNK